MIVSKEPEYRSCTDATIYLEVFFALINNAKQNTFTVDIAKLESLIGSTFKYEEAYRIHGVVNGFSVTIDGPYLVFTPINKNTYEQNIVDLKIDDGKIVIDNHEEEFNHAVKSIDSLLSNPSRLFFVTEELYESLFLVKPGKNLKNRIKDYYRNKNIIIKEKDERVWFIYLLK